MEAELSRLRAIIAAAEAPEAAAAPKRRRRGQTSIKVGPSGGGKSRRSTRTSVVGISPLLSTAAAAAAAASAAATAATATAAGATPTGSVQNTPRTAAAAGSLAVTQLPALSDLDPQVSVEALAVKAPRVLAKLKRLTATVVEKRELTKQGSRAVLSHQNSRAQLRSQRSSTAAAAAAAAADDSAAELAAAVAQFSKQSSELKAQLASAQRAAQRRDEVHSAAVAHLQAQLTALQAAKQGLVEVLQRCRGTVAVTAEEVQLLELEGDWSVTVPDAVTDTEQKVVAVPITATLAAKPSQLQQHTAAAAAAATMTSTTASTTTAPRLTLTLAAVDALSDSSILSASARVRPATTGSSSSRHYSTQGMHRGIGHSARLQQQQQQQCASCSVQGSLQQWHSTDWQRAGDTDALPLTYADVDSLLWKPPSYSCAVQCNLGDDDLVHPQSVAVPETLTAATATATAAAAAVQDAAAADAQGSLAFAALHAEPHALQQLLALAVELTALQAALASGEHVSASSLLAALTRCTALHVPLLQRTAARYAHLCDRWKRVASHAAADRGCTGSGADRAFLCCLCFSDRRISWGWSTASAATVGAAGASHCGNDTSSCLYRGTLRPHTSSGLRQCSTAASSHAIATGSSSAAQLYNAGAASAQRYTVSAAAGDDKRALLRARLQQSASQPELQFLNSFRSAKQRNSSSGHKTAATAVTTATRRPHTSAGVRIQRSVPMSTAAAAAAQHDERSLCSSVLIDLYSNSGSVVHSTSGSIDQQQQQQYHRGTRGPSALLTRQRPVTADTAAVRVAVSNPIGIY
jgi:hypothetical protein